MGEADEAGKLTKGYGFNPQTGSLGLWGTDPMWQAEVKNDGFSATGTKFHYLHTDYKAAPTLATTRDGTISWKAIHEAFGATGLLPNSNSISMNLRLPGQYFDDEVGRHYNLYRDYFPISGRYAEGDQLGLGGGVNFYLYGAGNPLSKIDPSGEFAWLLQPTIITGITVIVTGAIIVNSNNGSSSGSGSGAGTRTYDPGRDCNGNCNPCNPPAGQKFNIVVHMNAHSRTPGEGSHGCEAKTGSPIHWHYSTYRQSPANCMCYLAQHEFGDCGYP